MKSQAIRINIGNSKQPIPAVTVNTGQPDITVTGRPNPHYITYDSFQTLIQTELNPRYITKEDFEAYKDYVSVHYITEETFNQQINSLNIPRKLTDLDIDLALVKYDPTKDYLEVVEQ